MRISREDLLNALGFETKRSGYIDMFLMFGAGLIAGAGVGLLLAPKTGTELRQDVLERAGDLRGKAGELVSNVKSKLMNKANEYPGMGANTGV